MPICPDGEARASPSGFVNALTWDAIGPSPAHPTNKSPDRGLQASCWLWEEIGQSINFGPRANGFGWGLVAAVRPCILSWTIGVAGQPSALAPWRLTRAGTVAGGWRAPAGGAEAELWDPCAMPPDRNC